jgi:colanic acid/amylovoran biosynthesis glycosyltransferase
MKPTIIVYIELYCAPTMTFVHRQVLALDAHFNVIVVCRKRLNAERFPGNVTIIRRGIVNRGLGYVKRKIKCGMFYSSDRFIKTLRSIVSNENPVAIISHFGPAGIEVAEAIEGLPIRHFCVIHGYDGSKLLRNSGYVSQLNKCTKTQFIFASKSMMENFSRYGIRSNGFVHYLGYNGAEGELQVNRETKHKFSNRGKIIFFQAANLVEKKGHKYSLEALSIFQRSYENFEYWIAGSGTLVEELKMLVEQLGLAAKVRFLGHLSGSELQNAFHAADIFMHHSVTAKDGDQESIPTVIMEAMFQGIPVISTYHSGIPELIHHRYNGFLGEEKNVQSIVENIRLALFDDGSVGKNARDTVIKNFNFLTQISKMAVIVAPQLENRVLQK